jgi:hypothetical protein
MVAYEQILEIGKQIAQEFAPERIILFGSYAYGTPTEDSRTALEFFLANVPAVRSIQRGCPLSRNGYY